MNKNQFRWMLLKAMSPNFAIGDSQITVRNEPGPRTRTGPTTS